MTIRLLLKLLGVVVLAFPGASLISAFLFEGGGFFQRFLSGIVVMTTTGFDTLVRVPPLLGSILAITGLVLASGTLVIVGLILLKLVVRVVVQDLQRAKR